jgi:hypothetical protein
VCRQTCDTVNATPHTNVALTTASTAKDVIGSSPSGRV